MNMSSTTAHAIAYGGSWALMLGLGRWLGVWAIPVGLAILAVVWVISDRVQARRAAALSHYLRQIQYQERRRILDPEE